MDLSPSLLLFSSVGLTLHRRLGYRGGMGLDGLGWPGTTFGVGRPVALAAGTAFIAA